MILIKILEYIPPKSFYLRNHIPVFVICNIFLNIIHNPKEKLVCHLKFFDQFIYSLFFYLDIIKTNSQISGQIKFTCQITEYTLEECINRFDAEIIIIVDKIFQSNTSIFNNLLF